MQVAEPLCLAARRDDEAWQWHERFGALKRLSSTEMVRGLPCLDHVEQLCDVCVLTVTPPVLQAYLAPRFRPKKISETISRILKFDLYLKVSLVASYIELTS